MEDSTFPFIIECPSCEQRVPILCTGTTTLQEEIDSEEFVINFTIVGSTKHKCE